MAQDLEKLIVSLETNLKQYERGLAKAQNVTMTQMRRMERDAQAGASRIEGSLNRVGKSLTGFGKGLVIGGVTAAVSGLQALVIGSISSAAAIGDLSEKLGITSTKLQEIQYGAVQANLGFDEMEGGLLKFSKALGQAQNGAGDLLKTLEANGFTKAEVKAMDYARALDVVANLIGNAKNEQDALLITTQAFGKGGDGFLELLRGGSEGLKSFAAEAKNANAIIDDGLIKSAQKFDDGWSAALLNAKAGVANFVLGSLPYINSFDKAVSDAADSLGLALGTLTPESISARNPIPLTPGNTVGKGDLIAATPTKIVDAEVAAAAAKARAEADSKAKQAANEARRAYEAKQQAIASVISTLKFEGDQLNRNALQQEIATQQRQAGVAATSAQGQAIAALVTKNYELQSSMDEAIAAGERQLELDQELYDSKMALAEAGVAALDAIIIQGQSAGDVIENLAKQMASAALQSALLGQGPLASLFGTSGSGGFLGGLLGNIGARANGGPVSAGQPYVVGEKRPELFVPSQSGRIIPSVGGGANVNIQVNNMNGSAVRMEKSRDANGQPNIRLMIEDAAIGAMTSHRGKQAMKASNGKIMR